MRVQIPLLAPNISLDKSKSVSDEMRLLGASGEVAGSGYVATSVGEASFITR